MRGGGAGVEPAEAGLRLQLGSTCAELHRQGIPGSRTSGCREEASLWVTPARGAGPHTLTDPAQWEGAGWGRDTWQANALSLGSA